MVLRKEYDSLFDGVHTEWQQEQEHPLAPLASVAVGCIDRCLRAGNLLRTADGKICILDFGLMTEVAPERRIALVEYIAHLSVQDWNGVAKDLVNLGFTPEGKTQPCSSAASLSMHSYGPVGHGTVRFV